MTEHYHSGEEEEDMDPSVAFLTNSECPTCVFRERYRKLGLMEDKLYNIYSTSEDEDEEALEELQDLVDQERQDLLDFANFIAETTCKQVKVAAHALWN